MHHLTHAQAYRRSSSRHRLHLLRRVWLDVLGKAGEQLHQGDTALQTRS
jgi:hypothetical protein